MLKVAYDLAGTQGLESVHARTVAAQMGVNHATVHYYYRTRTELLAALTEYLGKQLERDLERASHGVEAGIDALEAELAVVEAYAGPESRWFKVLCALLTASGTMPALGPGVQGVVLAWRDNLKNRLAACSPTELDRKSPLARADLLAAALLGLVALAQSGVEVDVTAELDELFGHLVRA